MDSGPLFRILHGFNKRGLLHFTFPFYTGQRNPKEQNKQKGVFEMKKLTCLGLALVMALSLAACGRCV